MVNAQEQFAREEPGVSSDDLVRMKSRAEASEQVALAEREARQKVEKERDALAQQNVQATERIRQEVAARVQADETAITQAISAATSEKDSAAKELADALAANDATAISKAIDRQATARYDIIAAENQNRQLQNWKQQQVQRLQAAEDARKAQQEQRPRQEEQRQEQQKQQPRVEGGQIDISGYPAGHQEFFRKHPEIMVVSEDGQKERALVISDHWAALGRGIIEGTPSYYEYIEGALQGRRSEPAREQITNQDLEADGMEINLEQPQDSGTRVVRRDPPVRPTGARDHEVQTPAARQSAAALPPSRSHTPANGNQNGGRITLSVAEQEAARYSFPHLVKGSDNTEAYREYARNKAELQKEGRL